MGFGNEYPTTSSMAHRSPSETASANFSMASGSSGSRSCFFRATRLSVMPGGRPEGLPDVPGGNRPCVSLACLMPDLISFTERSLGHKYRRCACRSLLQLGRGNRALAHRFLAAFQAMRPLRVVPSYDLLVCHHFGDPPDSDAHLESTSSTPRSSLTLPLETCVI